MNIVPIRKEWLEVWSGVPKGRQERRWFVDYCTLAGKDTVADCPTEAMARKAADIWQLPLAEQSANLDKINAAGDAGGTIAARRMAKALGMPCLPDELCDPVEVLEARRAEGDQWMRDMLATHTKLTQAEIDDLLRPTPASRVDH